MTRNVNRIHDKTYVIRLELIDSSDTRAHLDSDEKVWWAPFANNLEIEWVSEKSFFSRIEEILFLNKRKNINEDNKNK